jgi:heparosan-N-sulfate-glucuronate 5-epimerase
VSTAARTSGESRRSSAGFLSSSKSFFLPLGPALDPERVRGYPIDLRVKARSSGWPPPEIAACTRYYVVVAQYGLGAYERWLAGDGEAWLAAARDAGLYLLSSQQPDGSWLHAEPLAHTFPLLPPWRCGMAQGEAASLLVRLHLITGEEVFAEAAVRALAPLARSREEGGVRASLDGRPWPEEYPTDPPSFVLNGAMFALWGLRDVGVALNDASAQAAFEEAVDTLAENLHRWDLGYWSRYDLFPHPVINVASSFYHDLHINQLRAMHRLAPRPQLAETAEHWERYAASLLCRQRALTRKALFRVLVPRTSLLARQLPWSPLRGV